MNIVRAVWFGAGNNGSDYMALVHGIPLGKLTLKRCLPAYALIPWTPRLDWLEAEVRSWGLSLRRCWPDERIGMRDLVVELRADAGLIVQGTTGDIDAAELELAEATLRLGPGLSDCPVMYESKRIEAYMARYLVAMMTDVDEWGHEIMSPKELQALYERTPKPTEEDTREIRARNAR